MKTFVRIGSEYMRDDEVDRIQDLEEIDGVLQQRVWLRDGSYIDSNEHEIINAIMVRTRPWAL